MSCPVTIFGSSDRSGAAGSIIGVCAIPTVKTVYTFFPEVQSITLDIPEYFRWHRKAIRKIHYSRTQTVTLIRIWESLIPRPAECGLHILWDRTKTTDRYCVGDLKRTHVLGFVSNKCIYLLTGFWVFDELTTTAWTPTLPRSSL